MVEQPPCTFVIVPETNSQLYANNMYFSSLVLLVHYGSSLYSSKILNFNKSMKMLEHNLHKTSNKFHLKSNNDFEKGFDKNNKHIYCIYKTCS